MKSKIQSNKYSAPINQRGKVDFQSHEGLRGAASIWILLFHSILFSKLIPDQKSIDFQGSSIMPLFFMLSGFSLAAAYGSSKYILNDTWWRFFLIGRGTSSSTVLSSSSEEKDEVEIKAFNFSAFYRNRFARVLPLYYLCNILSIPLWVGGYGTVDLGKTSLLIGHAITNFFACTTMLGLIFSNIDGPSWTICTLLIFWYVFPKWVPHIQRMTDAELLHGILRCYYIQLLLIIVIFVPVLFVNYNLAFAIATMHPLSRFPLFLMGAYAGILCHRHANKPMPWIQSISVLFPLKLVNNVEESNSITDYWANISTRSSILILILTLIVTIADILVKILVPMGGILGQVWLQALVPFFQLHIIVALTRDGGQSLASKALRTKLAKWLGEISMTIYLVHWPLIYYLSWIVKGKNLNYPSSDCMDLANESPERKLCEKVLEDYMNSIIMPDWGIPVVFTATLIISPLIYYFIEVPSRRFFRHK